MIYVYVGFVIFVIGLAEGHRLGYRRGRRDVINHGITDREFLTITKGEGFPKSRA